MSAPLISFLCLFPQTITTLKFCDYNSLAFISNFTMYLYIPKWHIP